MAKLLQNVSTQVCKSLRKLHYEIPSAPFELEHMKEECFRIETHKDKKTRVKKKEDGKQHAGLQSKSSKCLQGEFMMASLGSQHTSRGKITDSQ